MMRSSITFPGHMMKIDSDYLLPAATLTAALLTDKTRLATTNPDEAAKLFFDVLKSLQAEGDKRRDPSPPG
jgi:hypothetical protein